MGLRARTNRLTVLRSRSGSAMTYDQTLLGLMTEHVLHAPLDGAMLEAVQDKKRVR